MLNHDPMIRCQIGFAFGSVNQHRIDLFVIGNTKFCMRRKTGPAKSDNAGVLDGRNLVKEAIAAGILG